MTRSNSRSTLSLLPVLAAQLSCASAARPPVHDPSLEDVARSAATPPPPAPPPSPVAEVPAAPPPGDAPPAPSVDADKEAAKALYVAANDLRDRGNTAAALPKYKAAYDLAHTPVLALALAKAHIALGQLKRGRAVLLGVVGIPVPMNESALSAAARAEAAALADKMAARLSTLTLVSSTNLNSVKVDDEVIEAGGFESMVYQTLQLRCAVGRCAIRVDPGRHVITSERARGGPRMTVVSVAEGQSADVRLP